MKDNTDDIFRPTIRKLKNGNKADTNYVSCK